jgi:ceramide glucosyltransferase
MVTELFKMLWKSSFNIAGGDVAAVTGVLLILLAGGIVYSLLSIIAAFQYLSVPLPELASQEPISILKPLSGLDLGLESNLRTFFEQDYPAFEILFALRETTDPAAAVVEKLQREYPHISARERFGSRWPRLAPRE